jgi:hypothetical protein
MLALLAEQPQNLPELVAVPKTGRRSAIRRRCPRRWRPLVLLSCPCTGTGT